jgi:hypothetical protein
MKKKKKKELASPAEIASRSSLTYIVACFCLCHGFSHVGIDSSALCNRRARCTSSPLQLAYFSRVCDDAVRRELAIPLGNAHALVRWVEIGPWIYASFGLHYTHWGSGLYSSDQRTLLIWNALGLIHFVGMYILFVECNLC